MIKSKDRIFSWGKINVEKSLIELCKEYDLDGYSSYSELMQYPIFNINF